MPRQIRLNATQEGSAWFDIVLVYPVIANQRMGHGHNLALIRGSVWVMRFRVQRFKGFNP